MDLLVDTTQVAGKDQFAFYEAALRQRLAPFRFRRKSASHHSFRARLSAARLGSVDLVYGTGGEHQIGQDAGCGQANPYTYGLVMALPGCRAVQRLADRDDIIEPGSLILTDNRKPGWLSFPHAMNVLTLQFPEQAMPGEIAEHLNRAPLVIAPDDFSGAVLSSFVASLPRRAGAASGAAAVELGERVLGLLALALRERGILVEPAMETLVGEDLYCRSALDLIDCWLDCRDLSPAKVAVQLGISERHLYRLLAARGLRFGNEVLRRRLARVAGHMRDPQQATRSLTDIALAQGFSNSSHFSRAFREHYGCSPREYRRQAI